MDSTITATDTSYFQWPDYLVLFIMLAISAAIGIFYACTGGKQRSTKEYLLADGNMHWFPVSCSLLASYISTNALIGVPAEVYVYGTGIYYTGIGLGLGTLLSEIFFLPVYEQLGIISIYQYVELRFGRPLKLVVAVASLISMLFYAALVIYGPALSIAAVTGVNIWISIFSMALISILYTTVGGLKAVLWTDAFQLSLMLIGIFIVVIYGVNVQEDTISGVWQAAKLSGRLDAFESRVFDFDPRVRNSFWGTFLNGVVLYLGLYGCNQASVQRYLSLRSRKHKKIAYIFTSVGAVLIFTISVLIGLSVFGYFKFCDPLSTKEIFSKDQLYPLYVMRLFGHLPGLPGLLLSALFSTALSTISSLLNSGALILLEDFVKPCMPGLTDKKATVISKVMAFSMGIVALILVMFIKYTGGGIASMAVALVGMFGGPILGLFIAGIYIPIASTKGAFIGFIAGAAYGATVGIGGMLAKPHQTSYPTTTVGCNITDKIQLGNLTSPIFNPDLYDPHPYYKTGALAFFDQSYNWTSVGGCLVTFLMILFASMIFSRKSDVPVNQALLSPFIISRSCLMAPSWRAHIDYDSPPLNERPEEQNGNSSQNRAKISKEIELSNDCGADTKM